MNETLQWKSHERQYTLTDTTFTKSELPEKALPVSRSTGLKVHPRWSRERLRNEAATLRFIGSHTTIPVPKVLELYEQDGLLHLVTERASGCPLDQLASPTAVSHVDTCIQSLILPQLQALRHHTMGSVDPGLPLIPPSRITYRDQRPEWSRRSSSVDEFVMCHNDLGQHNIFVDPDTFSITAIIDWEFAGFFPGQFESPLWLRPYNEQDSTHLETEHLVRLLTDGD